jgi:hypothetical protein
MLFLAQVISSQQPIFGQQPKEEMHSGWHMDFPHDRGEDLLHPSEVNYPIQGLRSILAGTIHLPNQLIILSIFLTLKLMLVGLFPPIA